MTIWVPFFQVLCRHRQGHDGHLDARIVSSFDDHHTNRMAQTLYMVPMPDGHPMELTKLAIEWLQTEGAA